MTYVDKTPNYLSDLEKKGVEAKMKTFLTALTSAGYTPDTQTFRRIVESRATKAFKPLKELGGELYGKTLIDYLTKQNLAKASKGTAHPKAVMNSLRSLNETVPDSIKAAFLDLPTEVAHLNLVNGYVVNGSDLV